MSDSKVNAALLSAARELNQYLAQREGGNLTMAGVVLKVITEALEEGLSSPAWSLIVGPTAIYKALYLAAEYEGCPVPVECHHRDYDKAVVGLLNKEGWPYMGDLLDDAVRQAMADMNIEFKEDADDDY